MSLLLRLIDADEPGLHGRPVREGRRRGRVGRLDEEFRQQLIAEQEERIAAQVRALLPAAQPVEPDYARLADMHAALAMHRVNMALSEFLQQREAAQAKAEREAAEMQAAILVYVEALRIADERDEEDALEALLFAV